MPFDKNNLTQATVLKHLIVSDSELNVIRDSA